MHPGERIRIRAPLKRQGRRLRQTRRKVAGHRHRLQRLLEGHVQVNGPRRVPHGRRHGPVRHAPQVPQGTVRDIGRRQLLEETGGTPEQVNLVDGLVRVSPSEPGRPIGRENEKGDLGLARFHHRGQEVRHRRPRGGDHRRRNPGGLPHPQRQEPGRPFVHLHRGAEAGIGRHGQDQGGGTGPGRHHHMPHTCPGQLVQEDPGPELVPVLGGHVMGGHGVLPERGRLAPGGFRSASSCPAPLGPPLLRLVIMPPNLAGGAEMP